jgi:hypothetical protein
MPIAKGRKLEHFKSKTAYKKYQAYIHIHKVPHHHKRKVVIAGKIHHVKQSKERCPFCTFLRHDHHA